MFLEIRKSATSTYYSTCFGVLHEKFVVFDENYSNLTLKAKNLHRMDKAGKRMNVLEPMCFYLSNDKSGWAQMGEKCEGLDFVVGNESVVNALLSGEKVDASVLEKAKEINAGFEVKEFYEVKSVSDAKMLTFVAHNFHDSNLEKIVVEQDYTTFVFDSTWDYRVHLKCANSGLRHNLKVEDRIFWFYGDVEFCDDKIVFKSEDVVAGKEGGFIETSEMSWKIIVDDLKQEVYDSLCD